MNDVLSKIEQPEIGGFDRQLVQNIIFDRRQVVQGAIWKASYPKYLHYSQINSQISLPQDIDKQSFWAAIKLIRKWQRYRSQINVIGSKKVFSWLELQQFRRIIHDIDVSMTISPFGDDDIYSQGQNKRYLHAFFETEAICSAQITGATIVDDDARCIISQQSKPKDKSEKMVLNNYNLLLCIDGEFKNKSLSQDLLQQMQQMIISDGWLIDIKKQELDKLIEFANQSDKKFIHPVIKAIQLHFWMGYLQPFSQGNGRLARALFYWYLLKAGYQNFAFSPISSAIKKHIEQYREAYIFSHQDDNDLTYFIDFNLRMLGQSREEFIVYCKEKSRQRKQLPMEVIKSNNLNDRQIEAIIHLNEQQNSRIDIATYSKVWSVARNTAKGDLLHLQEQGFLTSVKTGKNLYFYPTDKMFAIFT